MEQPNYWQRLQAKRLSRRRLLMAGGTAALGGVAALAVGCGGDGVAKPGRGGNVTFGRLVNVLAVDPHIDLTGLDVDRLVYSYLYDWNPIGDEIIFNNLAESLEMPDQLEFIFTLRPGFMTHPGDYPGADEEITSEDVRQSFLRRGSSITAPDKRFPYAIAGGRDKTLLDAALQAPDRYTFRFRMAEPFVPAIREMARPNWAIVPAKVIDEFRLGLSQRAHGSGPFMLEELRGNERVVLRRHPNYFHKGCPHLDTITYAIITDNAQLLEAFESGAHDVNGAVLTRDWYDAHKDDSRFSTSRANDRTMPVIQFKVRKPPFDDPKVREAIDLSLDREAFINTILGGEGNYNGPVPWSMQRWALPQEELRAFYGFDPARAKALLMEAGYGDGFGVKWKVPKGGTPVIQDIASLVASQISEVNIVLRTDEVDISIFIASVILPGNFDMTLFMAGPFEDPDAALRAYHNLGITGNGNWTNYANDEIGKLIDAQAREFDPVKRRQIIFEAQRLILREHAPQITLPSGFNHHARWSYVHLPFEEGQEPPPDMLPYGCDIWTEKA
jgi:peptide/nickel transport system substrate-binding protein